jgi:long-chain acyl-CoA synthetase
MDEDYYLFIQERKEDIIIKGGFHIFPTEIEKLLLNHAAVAEVAVVGVADSVQGAEVKAFVVLKKDHHVQARELFDYCSESLPVYKSPKYFEFVKSLPKSSTGRVLKRVLRSMGEKGSKNRGDNSHKYNKN